MGGQGVLVVERRVAFEVDVQRIIAAVVDVEGEVLDGTAGEQVQPTHQITQTDGPVEQHDVHHRSEEPAVQGRAAVVAADVLVAILLVAQRTGDLEGHRCHQVADGRVGRDVHADRYDVGHHAARAAQRGGGANGHRQAHDDVGAPGDPMQVGSEGRGHDGSGTGVEPRRRGGEHVADGLVGDAVESQTTRRGRGGAVGQGEAVRQTLQGVLPESAVGREPGRGAVGAFRRVQRGQVTGLAVRGRNAGLLVGVQLGDALHGGDSAVSVPGDVVHAGVPEVAVVLDAEDDVDGERIAVEIDRGAHLLLHPVQSRGDRVRLGPDVDPRGAHGGCRVHDLIRLTVDLHEPDLAGLQFRGRASAHAPEQIDVEVALHVDVLRDGERNLGSELLGEPQAGLRRGERERIGRRPVHRGGRVGRFGDSRCAVRRRHRSLLLVGPVAEERYCSSGCARRRTLPPNGRREHRRRGRPGRTGVCCV